MAIAIASMLFGNLLALRQNNVKRILAYSSIANLGYLLVAFLAGGPRAYAAVAYYLVSYIAAILCSFGVIAVLSNEASDLDDIAAYRGLFWQRPWMAAIMTIALLSLASIPLTAGFVGKFYVLAAGVGSSLWLLVLVLVAGSGIGLYYYLRIIVAMAQNPNSESPVQLPATPFSGNLALTALEIALVWLGVYPAPFVRLIESAARL
jgi:NADH-quinone oxidoreductase subunit N